jgi:Domain of unknown function (DUF222)
MSSNSPLPAAAVAVGPLAGLAAAVDALAAEDVGALPDSVGAGQVLQLRALLERAEGEWLRRLAATDAKGAAGAESGALFGSTSAWLRAKTRMSARAANDRIRAARALHRGHLPDTAAALAAGDITAEHAAVIARALADLPRAQARAAEPLLLDLAREADPTATRRLGEHLRYALDPDGEDEKGKRRHDRRGLHVSTTWAGMVGIDGLLDPEAGETVLAAINALAKPAGPDDDRTAAQRRADALTELARRALDTDRLPEANGARPHMTITVDLDSLLRAAATTAHAHADDQPDIHDHPEGQADSEGSGDSEGLGEPGADADSAAAMVPVGQFSWTGPIGAETARRIACYADITRVVVRRHPNPHSPHDSAPDSPYDGADHDGDPWTSWWGQDPPHPADGGGRGWDGQAYKRAHDIVRAAMAGLPHTLGGPLSEPLDVGRASRVATPAQRRALAARDGGCLFPGCDTPPLWCEPHHWLIHWIDGGETNLDNLALLCRRHHRFVHEDGWSMSQDHHGAFTFTPPARAPTTARAA